MNNSIMIMGAMEDVELNILKDNLTNMEIEKENTCTFYKGELLGNPTILCSTNIGSINATVATLLGILKYNPKAIILQGIAGGHGDNVHVNDIVVATETININTIETVNKAKGEGSNSLEWNLNNFADESENINASSYEKLIELAKSVEYTHGNVLFGRVGSGDVWNKEADRISMLNEKYQTLCEEMEGYAIAKVANTYEIPMINIRAISNNEVLGEEYIREVGRYSQEFTLELIKMLC